MLRVSANYTNPYAGLFSIFYTLALPEGPEVIDLTKLPLSKKHTQIIDK